MDYLGRNWCLARPEHREALDALRRKAFRKTFCGN